MNNQSSNDETLRIEDKDATQDKVALSQGGRRGFMKGLTAGALSSGLAHFFLLGGGQKVWATFNDCASSAADSCPSPSKISSDWCSVSYPDTCFTNGKDSGDACGSGENDSKDQCTTANPGAGYDSCSENIDNPDVCNPPYTAQDGDECTGGTGDTINGG